MNVIGISGLSNSVAFKMQQFPGLTAREYHIVQGLDAAAALVNDQGILAAAAEERFTHEKGTGAFPVHAIKYCLQAGKLRPEEVDFVAHGFSYEPWKSLFQIDEAGSRAYQEVYSPEVQRRYLDEHFPGTGWGNRLVAVPHHLAHAASAFYPSGFEQALILVSDGMGEAQSMTVAVGEGTQITTLKEISAFHSLGVLYGVFTLYLGFYMGSDEYKVMGLAPYGNPRRFLDQMLEFVSLKSDGTYTLPVFSEDHTPTERETHAGILRFLGRRFGPPRNPEEEITQFHKDIAAALQEIVQRCQLHVLQHFQRRTGQKNLCLAGGVALNCSANGVIRRSGLFERVFVQPAAGDDGSALGAALYAYRSHAPDFRPRPMTVPLWGPEFSDDEIGRTLTGRDDCALVEMDSLEALCREVARRLDQGQIVGWFQGRMEFGPRALGSRSILADPRDPAMRDRINALVKKREAFRPFAPVVTREAAAHIFEIPEGQEDTYAHMLFVEQVRPEYRDRLPATTHVDGSARLQTVSREDNPRLWALLREFEKLSGLPVLLNTSFNVRGQPIVCTPQEALDTFLSAKLDVLVAGNCLVIPRGARLSSAERRQVLFEWNRTAVEDVPAGCLHELFEAQARKTPDAVALVFENQQLTYRELDARANRLARRLQQCHVGPEVLAGICMEVSLEMMVGLLGVLKAGGAYVPLDPDYPTERLDFMVQDARLPVVLTQHKFRGLLSNAIASSGSADAHSPEMLCLDTEWADIEGESSEPLASGAKPENLAYVIYTSGSTGTPKGVMIEHRNVANFFAGMDRCLGAESPGVWLALTSISFDISVLELFWTLARGFKVVLQRRAAGHASSLFAPARQRGGTTRPIDFSLFYFASDEGAVQADKYRLLLEGAKFADENGFAAIWTPERHFHSFGGLYPNPSVTSAALAVTTRRIQIRAGSVVLPLHHPVRVAEEWAVVDNLSHGRVGISFASGWQINDFALAPDKYAHRKEIMVRQIDLVRRLWRGETVVLPGADGQEVKVNLMPRPIQPELPFWVTASGSPETFRLAGELGAHLLTHLLGQSTDELAEKIAAYRAAWNQKGHPGEGRVTLMLHTFVGADAAAVRSTVRPAMLAYLRSSIDLIKNAPTAFPVFKRLANARPTNGDTGPAHFTEEELELMSSHAFDRYFETSGLFGTPTLCLRMVDHVRSLGVDEIACLIDFGVEAESVLAALRQLNEVRLEAGAGVTPRRPDYSLAAQVERHGVTHLQCTPSLAAMLAEDPKALAALRSLKMVLLGGEALPADLVQRLALPGTLLNMYGPTETTIWSATHVVDKARKPIPIGRPIANTQLYIVDENLCPVPVGAPGELLIGGAGVVRGYLNRPELTAERFIPNPFASSDEGPASTTSAPLGVSAEVLDDQKSPSANRVYRTGDLARFLPDGTIEFLGRIDQQVKLRGFRIELGEIEVVLRQHPAVKDCAAAVREESPGDKRLMAWVVPMVGSALEAAQLREFLAPKLPDFMVPSTFIFVPELPLTPNGKLDRKSLSSNPPSRSSTTANHNPAPGLLPPLPQILPLSRTGIQPPKENLRPRPFDYRREIIRVWRELLGAEEVVPESNFFELGGNSILAMQLISRLRKALGWEVPLRLAFEYPTLEGLGGALAAQAEAQVPGSGPPHQVISRRAPGAEAPLSFPQERLWFLNQLEPGPHYNDHFDLRLTGPLEVEALKQAINEIVTRHEVLRARFACVDGKPVQHIMPMLVLAVPVIDLSELAAVERESAAATLAVQETRRLFNLEEGPLLRACLLRLAKDDHILVLTFHHIVIDGWSRGVWLRELAALYGALVQGAPPPLPALPVQYADFAAWQQEQWRKRASLGPHLEYWQKQLAGTPSLIELPADRPRPATQSYRGVRESLSLEKALLERLSQLGQKEGCTLFMVLLAGFQALIARYTGKEDLVIGSPVAGRTRAELEGLMGCFLNPLVLRADLSGDPSFHEILRRTRRVALDAYAHQEFPFEKLVAELRPVRDLGYSPVFQIMFVMQNAPAPLLAGGHLNLQPFEIDSGVSKLDLTLSLEETASGCTGWIEYSTDLFDAARIKCLIQDFHDLLEAVATRPSNRLSQFPLAASGPAGPGGERPCPPQRKDGERGAMRPFWPLANGHRPDSPVSPGRSPVEKELARIWSEVLGRGDIRRDESLFDLGGHSLLITMISSRIRKAFHVEVPIPAFFETPTLGEIAGLIENELQHAPNGIAAGR